MFRRGKPVDQDIQIPEHKGRRYLNQGLHRVYSTGSWSENWRKWSKRNGQVDVNGAYITNVRPYHNGKQREYYVDMSMADIDLTKYDMIQPFDPTNTKYMNSRYLGGISLHDVSHLPTMDFERLIATLGSDTRYGGKK
jgi:hypothetical protein